MTGGLGVSASSPREAGRSAIGEQNPVDRPTLGRPVAPFESVRGRDAPYEVNAVAPNVLPFLNSHMPASGCAKPACASARARTTWTELPPMSWALVPDRTIVVRATLARPSGAGFAVLEAAGAAGTAGA